MYTDGNSQQTILNRMLQNISNDVAKFEGSFTYDALSPTSNELAQVYITDDNILKRTSPYTATGTDLENITNPYGVTRKPGKKATTEILVNAVVGTFLKSGILFGSSAGLMYQVTRDTVLTNQSMLVNIEAIDVGSKYNVPANVITQLPVQVNGVISMTNPNPVTNGYDAESDESLRERYFERLQTPATSGNKYHYRNWAKEVTGVGDAKVFPLWAGKGTVKVVVIDSNKKAAASALINTVLNHIEENRPIGATPTVVSAVEKKINISAKLVLSNNYTIQQVQDKFSEIQTEYFKSTAFKDSYISYARIGNLLLNTPGVIDYIDLKINGAISNIGFEDEEIPVLGILSLGV